MNIDIKNLKTAKRYAIALKQSALDSICEVLENLESVNEIIFNNSSFKAFFLHPNISLRDKKELIAQSFEGKINPVTYNFLQTLLDENRFSIFNTILELFKNEVDLIQNKQRVEVISAVDLDENQKQRLQEKLSEKFNKEAIINYFEDKNILGGLVIKFEDNVIDLSLKTKFEKIRKQLI